MTTDRIMIAKPRLWLLIAGALTLVSIGVLWPLQFVGQICPMIYPAPPGCFAEEPRWVPFVAIGLIVAAFAAAVVVYFTVSAPRTVLVLLSGGILAILLVGSAVVALSQTGVWDPVQPPVMIE